MENLIKYRANIDIRENRKLGIRNQGVKCENDMKWKKWQRTYKKKTIGSPPPKYSNGRKQIKKIQGVKYENDIKIKRWYRAYKKKMIRSPPPKYSKDGKQNKKNLGSKMRK